MTADLRESLRQWRYRAAQGIRKPAFCVFSNKVLDAIVEAAGALKSGSMCKMTERDLLRVKGMGNKKVETYGESILRIINQHSRSSDNKTAAGVDGVVSWPDSPLKRASAPHSSNNVTKKSRTLPVSYSAAKNITIDLTTGHPAVSAPNASPCTLSAPAAEPRIARSTLTAEQVKIADAAIANNENIFLEGAAGTGKSYLFKYIRQQLIEKYGAGAVAVTAPTGVAAINVSGRTIHSFSGVGLGRGNVDVLLEKVRKSSRSVQNWKKTRVLMIDEVSMLGGNLFST